MPANAIAPPRPAAADPPPTTDPLADALRRALIDERDPDVRQWATRLLRGDAATGADAPATRTADVR